MEPHLPYGCSCRIQPMDKQTAGPKRRDGSSPFTWSFFQESGSGQEACWNGMSLPSVPILKMRGALPRPSALNCNVIGPGNSLRSGGQKWLGVFCFWGRATRYISCLLHGRRKKKPRCTSSPWRGFGPRGAHADALPFGRKRPMASHSFTGSSSSDSAYRLGTSLHLLVGTAVLGLRGTRSQSCCKK